jgi:CheY-like chemotaxis protein
MTHASPSCVASVAPAPGPPASHRLLVIADDSAEMRQFVRNAVGPAFGDVVEVCDGRELFWALLRARFAADQPPDIAVITDVAMPAYNGLDVLDAWGDEAAIPTIVMTAFPSDAVRARAAQLWVALLAKPFSLARLRRTVQDVLGAPAMPATPAG